MSHCDQDSVCIKVPQVVGVGECQVVIVGNLELCAKAVEIKRVSKTVQVDDWSINHGQVLLNGTVLKNVEYEREDHIIGSDSFQLHFDCCLEVPGAAGGDRFEFDSGLVCVEKDELVSPPTLTLFEKLCVHVVGTVTREIQLTITPTHPNVCPPVPTPCDDAHAE